MKYLLFVFLGNGIVANDANSHEIYPFRRIFTP